MDLIYETGSLDPHIVFDGNLVGLYWWWWVTWWVWKTNGIEEVWWHGGVQQECDNCEQRVWL